MAGTTKTVTLQDFIGELNQLTAGPPKGHFVPALKVTTLLLIAATKENFARGTAPDGTPWKPLAHARPRGGSKPLRDRGLLMASISGGSDHVEKLTDTSLTVGTKRIGANLHQKGGTVKPKRAKYLAIPLTVEAVRAGSPRNMSGLIFIPKKGGGKGGTMAAVKDGRRTNHFALVSSVTVPARPFLGWSKELTKRVDAVFADAFARLLTGGGP